MFVRNKLREHQDTVTLWFMMYKIIAFVVNASFLEVRNILHPAIDHN